MSTLHQFLTDSIDDDDYLCIRAVADMFRIDPFALVAKDLNHCEDSQFPASHEVAWPEGLPDIGWLYRELKEFETAKRQENLTAGIPNWEHVRLPKYVNNKDFCRAFSKSGQTDFWMSRDVLYRCFKFDPKDQEAALSLAGRPFPKPRSVQIPGVSGYVDRWLYREVEAFSNTAKEFYATRYEDWSDTD